MTGNHQQKWLGSFKAMLKDTDAFDFGAPLSVTSSQKIQAYIFDASAPPSVSTVTASLTYNASKTDALKLLYSSSAKGAGGIIYYNFYNTLPSKYTSADIESAHFKTFTAEERAWTRSYLDMIENFTKVKFVETTSEAQTHIGFASTALPSFVAGWVDKGDIWIDRTQGQDFAFTVKHEIGHTLGMMHSWEGGLTGEANTHKYTVMAYNYGEWGQSTQMYPEGYQLYDIYALQSVYGVNTSYNNADTIYSFDGSKVVTIWDGGGVDTLAVSSGANGASLLNLNEGSFSTISSGLREGIAIAYGVSIENATGGVGNDTLIGNALSNILNGGAGVDIVSYKTATSGVTVNLNLLGAQNTIGAGIDTLANIERLEGSEYGDTLTGSSVTALGGNDKIFGTSGRDTHDGGAGDDVFFSSIGDDYVQGGEGTDTVSFINELGTITLNLGSTFMQNTGASGFDSYLGIENVIGSSYGDSIYGGIENNTIEGGLGNDILNGGSGTDTISYAGASSGVTVNLGIAMAQNTIGAGVDTIANFENILGSSLNDTLAGTAGNNVINGGAGTDFVSYADATSGITVNLGDTRAQNTTGAGTDTLSSIEGVIGSSFNDTIYGGFNNDTIEGGAGNDVMDGGFLGSDTVSYAGAAARVTVNLNLFSAQDTQGAGIDTISGFENILGSSFNDTLIGNLGSNIIEGGVGNDSIDGGAGTDTASYARASSSVTVNLGITIAQNTMGAGTDTLLGMENILGSNYADVLTGNSDNNTIDGGLGNDTIDGATGNDVLIGGLGTDTLSYASATAAVKVNLSLTTAQVTVGAGMDTLSGFENLIGSAYDDNLRGDAGINTIMGGAGNDTIEGGAGTDGLNGGAGIDTLSYSTAVSAVTVSLAIMSQNTFGAGFDSQMDFENITGSNFNDTLSGNGLNNTVSGGAGNDVICGGAGADYLDGGAGIDTASYRTSSLGVSVSLSEDLSLGLLGAGYGGDAQGDVLANIENIFGSDYADTLNGSNDANTLNGFAGNDIAFGYGGADSLYGGEGNDTLYGGDGNDTLVGEAGTDLLYGGANFDTVSYETAISAVGVSITSDGGVSGFLGDANGDRYWNVEAVTGSSYDDMLLAGALNLSIRLSGGAGNDQISGGSANDELFGGVGNDSLSASGGNDVVSGDAGNDSLSGGYGNDTLNGGDGNDVLSADYGVDTLIGGIGADTFSFSRFTLNGVDAIADFNKSQGDKLDIHNLLVGFDALTKILADYVQMSESNGNTTLTVDVDGLGAAYSWTQIAILQATTGLGNVQTLASDGTLIT